MFMRAGGVVHFDLKHHTGKKEEKIKQEKKKGKKKKIFPAAGMVIRMELAFCYCRQKRAGSRGGREQTEQLTVNRHRNTSSYAETPSDLSQTNNNNNKKKLFMFLSCNRIHEKWITQKNVLLGFTWVLMVFRFLVE